jgi:hypothetical protein
MREYSWKCKRNVVIHFLLVLRTRDSEKGFSAPLPRVAGNAMAFLGLRSFLSFDLLILFLLEEEEATRVPSSSNSISMWQLARDHLTNVVVARQRHT